MAKKRLLLGAAYSVIEPLGLLHLAGLARDLDWDRKIHLVKDHNFDSFFDAVEDFKPDVVGFNVYTGNHLQLYDAFERLKKDHPNIQTILGGPHATYFPVHASEHADYVVMSEGFNALRNILDGQAQKGIMPMAKSEPFPFPDRETLYADYSEHSKSRIKSLITMTGCPYKCTYCYNSSTPADINVTPEIAKQIAATMGSSGRLFPHNVRSIDDVIKEGIEIAHKWPTEVIYFQDDVFGFDIHQWLPQFKEHWPKEVGIPYHSQMRFEMIVNESGQKRLDLVRESGGFGMTLAIEAADYTIRDEVLDRKMKEEIIFQGMQNVSDRDFKIRTEQITGLPYGATSKQTAMNLDADLGLVELNLRLRHETGLPTMAWGSTFAPYAGTKLGIYSKEFGHYPKLEDNSDVPDTFFDRSVLRFPNQWYGPNLINIKGNHDVWLEGDELERYRNQNAELRRIFNFVTLVPHGEKLAKTYLESNEPYSFERLGRDTMTHLKSIAPSNQQAIELLESIHSLNSKVFSLDGNFKHVQDLVPYFGILPKGKLALDRFLEYGARKGFSASTLSTATRHHLYDNVLYDTGKSSYNRVFPSPFEEARQSNLKI
ncbi:hypothetical protein COU57_05955 [Candidatus Pacearchaeota archaeon CG10_big_fil_rev_8_21_14_0_10_32_14]|nr:MAG: hypothetical protein COU57_05955 [Candidatus Pacearchaeota archaeon CG10_big_fil_rev_8_21_14_0_10_32_14]